MKTYDETVADIICFLRCKGVCLSTINSHKKRYQQSRLFMYEKKRNGNLSSVSDWIVFSAGLNSLFQRSTLP